MDFGMAQLARLEFLELLLAPDFSKQLQRPHSL